MARRWGFALALSVLAHIGLALGLLGAGARPWHGTIDVEITGVSSGQVTELPLGGPPPGGEKRAPAPRRVHHHAAAAQPKETDSEAGQLTEKEQPGQPRAPEEGGGPAPTDDLTAYGPRGSRLTVLLRLDRLRASDLAPGIDALLARLPDHQDLLQGTGLDLFKSFDALLIATPHPLDPTVTFLAARHHLESGELRQALTDGARATDRTLAWRADHGRWIGERHAKRSGQGSLVTRDDRLIVLPAQGLVVVTPPAYRALLLAPPARPPPADAGSDADGGAPGGLDWTSLLSRIDAEEGLMPPDGDAMMSAADIFKSAGGATPLVYGMEVPAAARAVAGMDGDEPFLDLTAQFADEAQARHWETEWPNLRGRLRTNPFVILGGFSAIVGRVTLERDERTIRVHLTATHDETVRLLGVALRLLGG
ncbi:MAG TPA: hypothetical protein VMT03_16325 [Polyangia bacterium]|nr:hypothetical protein [Polyangia bacterium]